MVRERASMLLSACLEIIKTREKSPDEAYRKIFEEARLTLMKTAATDAILGSLLAFGAMLQNHHIVSSVSIHQG
jgi:FKBP12-rapamycin complex-associated protein